MAEGGKKDDAYIASNMIPIINDFGAADIVANEASWSIIPRADVDNVRWPIIEHEFPCIICSW